jgi:hypothetical protein
MSDCEGCAYHRKVNTHLEAKIAELHKRLEVWHGDSMRREGVVAERERQIFYLLDLLRANNVGLDD